MGGERHGGRQRDGLHPLPAGDRSAGPVFASQTAYVITLAGMFWGILLLGERHSLYVWGALVLMLTGLALVRPRERLAQL